MSKFYCPRGVQGQSRVAQMQMIGVNPSHSLSSSIRTDLQRVSFIKWSILRIWWLRNRFLCFHDFSMWPKNIIFTSALDVFERGVSYYLIRTKRIVILQTNHFKDLNRGFELSNFHENTMVFNVAWYLLILQIFSIFDWKIASK